MKRPFKFIGMALFALAALAALGAVVMLLWNAVVPLALVAARPLDYWHAVGLLVLARILFGGFRGGRRGGFGRHRGGWQNMTAEERAQFQQRFGRGRHGCHRRGAADGAGDADGAPQA